MSVESNDCPLGVCVLENPAANKGRSVNYPGYIHEILAHAGLCYQSIAIHALPTALQKLKVLVTVGEMPVDDSIGAVLEQWIEAGGAWLSVGGVCGMESVLGVSPMQPTYVGWGSGIRSLGEGYLQPAGKSKILEQVDAPLHFFGGISVQSAGAEVLATALDRHGREDGSPAILHTQRGAGCAMLIAVDITGTVVRVQQGVSVSRDGVPPRDGSAPIDDAVLKSGDGAVLDWQMDRSPLPGVAGFSAFLRPIADLWCGILLRSIFFLAEQTSAAIPVLWLYPRNLPAIGHISHDTDNNEPEKAGILLQSLTRADIKSTWCVISPGYSQSIIEQIRRDGHELAMHYDAMTPGLPWGQEQFEIQWEFLCQLLKRRPISNKNHYLRWEGDMEFYDWLLKVGIEIDQSKGPSKYGEAGFNFGTSHPYFPVRFDGTSVNILELPTLTQDLEVFAPQALAIPLLEGVLAHHGIAHFLFHPAHFHRPATPQAMEFTVAEGKKRGIEWWTSEQINQWERARRKLRWSQYQSTADQTSVTLTSGVKLTEATILWFGSAKKFKIDDKTCSTTTVQRWGYEFQSITMDLPGHQITTLTIE